MALLQFTPIQPIVVIKSAI